MKRMVQIAAWVGEAAVKRLVQIAAVVALGFAANTFADDLETRVTASDGWVGYQVPMVAGVDGPCCYAVRSGAETGRGCNLDQERWSFVSDSDHPAAALDSALSLYLRVDHGRVERVIAVGGSCPIQTAGTVRWIDRVEPASSVAMLSSLRDRQALSERGDQGLMAIAYHAGTEATRALAALAKPPHARKEREQALFWLGQARGAEGADIVEHYATTDSDPKVREHAIFALSQSDVPDAYAHILSIARLDPAERVRSKALFWLAQMGDPRAKDDITVALKGESSDRVREQAVFALSQLRDEAADEALIGVLRGDYPRTVKKQALFWLGQSGSPRAMAYFDEALK